MDNRKKIKYLRIGMIIGYICVAVFFVYFFYTFVAGEITAPLGSDEWKIQFEKARQLQSKIPITFIFFFVGAILVNLCYKPYKRLKSGIMGEEKASKVLDILPTNYMVLSNVCIEHDGNKSEIDNLVISQNGIIIVETKNYKGLTTGNENDSEWVINKITVKGNTFQSSIKNPIKQVKRQTYILSQILKENDIHCWIDGYVYMAGGQCNTDSDKVFTDERKLLQAILDSGKENALDENSINKLQQILTK